MRRALLTATPSAPLSVGNPGTFGTSGNGIRTAVDTYDPATQAGTVTTVKLGSNTSGSVIIMVGSLSGSNFTVSAVSATQSAAIGLNTFTVSLPVNAGDFIGYWYQSSTGEARNANETGKFYGYSLSRTTAPTVGAVIALTTAADFRLAILGTG